MKVRFFGTLKGENQKENEIRKWNDHLTNLLGVKIEREFGIKYSKNRTNDAITFIAHKRAANLPAMYMKSLPYDGERYISKGSKISWGRRYKIKCLHYGVYVSRYGKKSF